MTAREVIRESLIVDATRSVTTKTIGILHRLTSAGFRILGPDEIDGPTVEKRAEVAETCPDTPFAISRKWYGDLRQSIPAAIRALKEKRT